MEDILPTLIRKNKFELCECTVVEDELLTRLCQNRIITQGLKETIMATVVSFSRASKLYDYLETRPDSDLDRIKEILLTTSNLKAYAILNGSGSEGPSQSQPQQTQAAQSRLKRSPTASEVAKTMCEAGGHLFEANWPTLHRILGVRNTNYVQWENQFKNGTMTAENIIHAMLTSWISKFGRTATVKSLHDILIKNEMPLPAAEILSIYDQTTHIKPD